MDLSFIDRTVLANQYRILERLADDGQKEDFAFKAEVLERGYKFYYEQVIIHENEVPNEKFTETMDILEMFTAIEYQIEKVSPAQRKLLDESKLSFRGFDTRHPHYHIAKFFVEKDNRFDWYKGRIFDSHDSSVLSDYLKMVKIFKSFSEPHRGMTFEQLKQLSDS